MRKKINPSLAFFWFYIISYAPIAVYGGFIPVYLEDVGFSGADIGILLSFPPLVSIFGQFFWGVVSDRASYKNNVLVLLLVINGATSLLFEIPYFGFWVMAIVMSIFTISQAAIGPMTDAITLEYIKTEKIDYGIIRMAGTIGFAIMSIVAGFILKEGISYMFPLYFILTLATILSAFILPKVKGHKYSTKKVSVFSILKNKDLLIKFCFVFFIHITLGFNGSFFGIYLQQLGGDKSIIGLSNFLAAISEVPFLLFSGWVFRKFRLEVLFLFAGALSAVKWLVSGLLTSSTLLMWSQIMHGGTFIVLAVAMAMYINNTVPDELKASGQMLHAIMMTVTRIIGTLLGGFLSDRLGLEIVFIAMAGIALLDVVVFAVIFTKSKKCRTKELPG